MRGPSREGRDSACLEDPGLLGASASGRTISQLSQKDAGTHQSGHWEEMGGATGRLLHLIFGVDKEGRHSIADLEVLITSATSASLIR